jgi:hypothetical protein
MCGVALKLRHTTRVLGRNIQVLNFKRSFTREGTLSGDLALKLSGGLALKL